MRIFKIVNVREAQVCIMKVTDPSGVLTCHMLTVFKNTLFSGTTKHSSEKSQQKYFDDFGTNNDEPNRFHSGITMLHGDAMVKGKIAITGASHEIITGHDIANPFLKNKLK